MNRLCLDEHRFEQYQLCLGVEMFRLYPALIIKQFCGPWSRQVSKVSALSGLKSLRNLSAVSGRRNVSLVLGRICCSSSHSVESAVPGRLGKSFKLPLVPGRELLPFAIVIFTKLVVLSFWTKFSRVEGRLILTFSCYWPGKCHTSAVPGRDWFHRKSRISRPRSCLEHC